MLEKGDIVIRLFELSFSLVIVSGCHPTVHVILEALKIGRCLGVSVASTNVISQFQCQVPLNRTPSVRANINVVILFFKKYYFPCAIRHQWWTQQLFTYSVLRHNMTKYGLVLNCTLRNAVEWNTIKNADICIEEICIWYFHQQNEIKYHHVLGFLSFLFNF